MVSRSAALGCLLASGCLLTTNLDGLSGGAGDASAGPDASTDVAVVSQEAGSDAADGGSIARDSGPIPCTQLFCADFDESDDITQGWSQPEVGGGGSIMLETKNTTSSPHAFAAVMSPKSDYDGALLTKYIHLTPSQLHLDVNVFFDKLDTSQDQVSILVLAVTHDKSLTTFSDVRVNAHQGSAELQEEYAVDGGMHAQGASNPYTWPLQKWIHLRIDVDATTATMKIDGTTYATLVKVGTWDQANIAVKLGIYYSRGQDGGQRVIFDDLVLDAK